MALADSYDPQFVNLFAGDHATMGWAEGTIISGSRNTDKVELSVGTKGEVTKVVSADDSGTVEITLKHNSSSLKHYNKLHKSSEWFTLSAYDGNDGSRIAGVQAVVASMGDYNRGDGVEDVTITILVAKYDQFF